MAMRGNRDDPHTCRINGNIVKRVVGQHFDRQRDRCVARTGQAKYIGRFAREDAGHFSREEVEIMWMKNKTFQRLGGGPLERFGLRLWSRLQFSALRGRKEPAIVALLEEIHRENRSLMSAFEQYLVYAAARAQRALPGAMAEVGVYRGASAKLICEAKGDTPLHLFDTFSGLPQSTEHDRGLHRTGQYECSLESVQGYLAKYQNVYFHPGLFPESAAGMEEQSYCFAHFDVDLYASTLACLEYFYPRMLPGGIILSHDYGLLAGVEKAFEEFFADKPEGIIEQPTTQCMVVKRA
jgi:hypothetical protein